jgi:hypothetical protein
VIPEHPIPPPVFKAPDEIAKAVSASGDTEDDNEEDDASDSEYRPGKSRRERTTTATLTRDEVSQGSY